MRGQTRRALFFILALAALVRTAVIVATPDFAPIYDAADYWRHANSIAAGDGYPDSILTPPGATAFRPPLYPLLLAAVDLVGGGWTAARLVGALLGVLAVFLVFAVAVRIWDERVALVAAAGTAVFPPLVILNGSLLSESLFVPLVLAVLLSVLVYRDDPRLRWAVVAGVMCGLTTLTRSNGPFLLACVVLGIWTMRPLVRRRALIASVVAVGCTVVVVFPWVVRNTMVFDRFVGVATQQGYTLAGTYNPESRRADPPGVPGSTSELKTFRSLYERRDLDEAQLGDRLSDSALDYAREHPGYVVETAAWNTLRVFDVVHDIDPKTIYIVLSLQATGVDELASPVVRISLYLVLALALAGVAAELRPGRSGRAPPFVWTVPFLTVLPAILAFGLSRYRAPVDPFLLMLAAVGAVRLVERFRPRGAR